MAPVDRGLERLMTRQRRPAPARQQCEPIGQAVEDLLHRQNAGPHRRELDRERQAVEPPADIHDRPLVCLRQLECARRGLRPLHKKPDRLVLTELVQGLGGIWRRQLERRHGEHVLTRRRQRLTAGGDDPHPRRGACDLGHEERGCVEQVLAVVQNQQQLPALEVAEKQRDRIGGGLIAQVQGGNDSVRDEP